MQGKLLYEYAVIRIVPRVEREEFLNAGVVMYLHGSKKLLMRHCLDDARLKSFYENADIATIKLHLNAFERISNRSDTISPIAKLDAASRFRWLTAQRSTIVQSSRVHSGFCIDPEEELKKLCRQYID